MRNAIAWSYELLLPEEQRLLRTLATFNGGFTMAAAEAVYAEPCQAMVAALVRKSLIRKMPGSSTPSRYVMLETIREFAADLPVPETEAAQTRKRFIAWFLDLAAAATSVAADQRNAAPLDEIEAEHGNFLVTLQWLEEEARWEEGLRLAADLALNWDVRGHLGDSRAWLERSLQPVRTAGMPPSLRAEAEARLAVILLRLNEIELAERYLHSARRYHETDGRRLSLAFVYLVLGGAAEARHDDVEGKHFFKEALRLYRLEENPAGISQSLTNLAEIAYRRRDYTTAQTLMQESMVHARASGRTVPVSYALAVNALIAHATGDDVTAMGFLREAITFSRDNQYEGGIGDALVIMALITANRGQAVIAARLLGAAEAVIERLGLPRLTHWPQHRDAITRTQELLDPARYEMLFREGQHLTPEDAVREALETEPPSMGQDIARFTPRELDVLRLLVAGKTNRAIADDLFLGTRTVESHVARILGKLGVNTRAAAVMAAVEHGLVSRTPATP